jgi:hypothetical protein
MSPAIVAESPRTGSAALAELQGLYGPFSFSEKLFQKIWLRGDFDRAGATTTDGRPVRVLHPGKWNLLGGPDFKGARLRLGDREIMGDVELHLHAADWAAHRHAQDPAYARVILHVVLFPPEAGHVTRDLAGGTIPLLVLLSLLHHDLEEYAADEAVATLADRPVTPAVEELGQRGDAELRSLLRDHAVRRWRQKIHFAQLRLQRLGWISACHHAALEILGYRFNRAPMLRVAARFPLEEWASGAVNAVDLAHREHNAWSLQGVRPANHPRTRLQQYAIWMKQRPDWPERLEAVAARWPVTELTNASTAIFRRAHRLTDWRRSLSAAICGDAIGGTRFDNLVCDGFLPLLAARKGMDGAAVWFHWFAGDLPAPLLQSLRALGVFSGPLQPAGHGAAQGLLGWLIEREGQAPHFAPVNPGRGA